MTLAVVSHIEASVAAWRHVRAIVVLPFMNTVMIPGVLLALVPDTVAARTLLTTFAGAALAAVGATLVVHSIRLFVRLGRGTLAPWDPTRELVSTGAYRFSRNPMKGGLFLVLAGETLLTRSSALAIWFVCFALANVLYIRVHEEPGLLTRFGASYSDYCARVPRWWPTLRSLRAAIH